MGFSRQEYWNGLPFPSPEDLPDPGIEPRSPALQADALPSESCGCNIKNDRMISVRFQGKPFNITVIQAYAQTSNAEEPEIERFYEYLQGLLELTPQKDILFIIGDWNVNVESQETLGVTGKFGLGVWNEA